MKNNKGFTLIELLAVVVILITIIVIITPKVFKQLKTAENVTDKEQINAIINATQLYMNQNTNLLPEQNEMNIISLNELKESGLIKSSQILNPSTKKELTGCIVVKYEKNKYKYEYKEENDCNNVITVTFDPQGGQLDQTTKSVIPNDTYGNLPTPTKEGYTFMGWNGKNMLDMTGWLNSFSTATRGTIEKGEDSIKITATVNDAYTNSYKSGVNDNKSYFQIPLNPNTQYTISWSSDTDNEGYVYLFVNNQQTNNYIFYRNNIHKSKTFMTPQDAEYMTYRVGVTKTGKSITYSNIQLEEGDTATPYEPYYITSDTTVVQENNHTLKAIWQAN